MSGREVLALVPSHHDHAIGEKIGIRLDAEHVITFPAESPRSTSALKRNTCTSPAISRKRASKFCTV